MIKVLFVGMTEVPGGMETYMMNIFLQLQGKKFQFYFVNTKSQPIAYTNIIKKHGGKIYSLSYNSGLIKYLTRSKIVERFFKEHHDFDIIHINSLSINDIFWAKIAYKFGIKNVIYQSHINGISHKSKIVAFFSKIMSLYNKIYINNHSYIKKLAASEDCGRWMFGKNSRFIVIPNGINTNYFYPSFIKRKVLKKELNIPYNYKVIITTARLSKQKNFSKIVKVFKCIHSFDKFTRLVIIGDGPERNVIKKMVHVLNLSQYVLFMGEESKKNIANLLNIGDLMLMPSYFEAVPFSLTEAQSEGIPAIVSYGVSKKANITCNVKYLSLNESNNIWAKNALNILKKSYKLSDRINMNTLVKASKYNISNSIRDVEQIYNKAII